MEENTEDEEDDSWAESGGEEEEEEEVEIPVESKKRSAQDSTAKFDSKRRKVED